MRHSLKQRFIALTLLMAYTITGTSVMPAAMALAAWIDGSHSLVVSQSESGMKLTLHHRSDAYTPEVNDHHNALARVLVRLCKASDAGDHQLVSSQFDSSANSVREDLARAAKEAPQVNQAATFQLTLIAINPARDTTRSSGFKEVQMPLHRILPMLATVQLMI
jgi:hypothetical protein